MVTPWVELYRPSQVKDIAGNTKAATVLASWVDNWPEVKKKAALLVGPPGVGKTTAAYAIAQERGLEVIEMNASDQRNREQILNIAGMTATHRKSFGLESARILLLDEVDGVFGRTDYGGIGAIVQVVRSTKIPIMMTANDLWNPKLASLRNVSEIIKFKRLSARSITKVLKKIAIEQNLVLSEQILNELASVSGGDLRAAINDLEALVAWKEEISPLELELGVRDQTKDIFNALTKLFQARTIRDALASTRGLDLDNDMFFQWIYENAYLHAGTTQELFQMYDELAHADVFRARIRITQNWKLLPYLIHHMTAGVALSKKSRFHWIKSNFPTRLSDLSRSRKMRTLRAGIYSKVGKKAHLSTYSSFHEYGFLLHAFFENNPESAAKIAIGLGLTSDEVKYLAKLTETALRPIRSEFRKFKKEYNVQAQEMMRRRMKPILLSMRSAETQRESERQETPERDNEPSVKAPNEESMNSKPDKPIHRTLDNFVNKKPSKKKRKKD